MRAVRPVLLVASVVLLSCATSTFQVTSSPERATVSTYAGLRKKKLSDATTPFQIRVRARHQATFTGQLSGYKTLTLTIAPRTRGLWARLFQREEPIPVHLGLEREAVTFRYLLNEDLPGNPIAAARSGAQTCSSDYLRAYGQADATCRKDAYLGAGRSDTELRAEGAQGDLRAQNRTYGGQVDRTYWASCMMAQGWIPVERSEPACLQAEPRSSAGGADHP